jgi:hypothetical protein
MADRAVSQDLGGLKIPEMTPVGQNIKPPDPQAGVGLMSSILGVRQQQQNLATGQINQNTAQAESQQAQQKNAELSAVGNLTKQAYASGRYKKDDGSFDNTKFAQDVSQVAPTYGQGIANDATSRAGEIYKNQQTLFNLDSSKRTQIGQTIGALAGKADVNQSDIIDAFEGMRQQHPDDKGLSRMLQSMQGAIPPHVSGPQLQQVLNTMGSSMTAQPSIAGQTNAAGQTINRGTFSGQLSPAGQIGGQDINPTSPTVAGQAKRQGEAAGSDFDRANQVSASVGPANQTVTITKEIDDLADQVHSGKISQAISKAAASVGLDSSTYARQLLEKDLGRLKATASAGAGTDQRQATVLSGFPDATSDNRTIHTAMDYTRGVARQDLARGQLLNTVKSKDASLRGFQHADDMLTGSTDPLMHEFQSLKDPQQQAEFYKRNFKSREDAKQFRDKVAGMGHLNVIGQ